MYKLYSDGGSRGNPGNAAIGYLIYKDNDILYAEGKFIGTKTNNFAEYTGIIKGLEKVLTITNENIEIFLDSELVVKQLNGIYKVKNPDMKSLYNQAVILLSKFKNYKINHVKREYNKEADKLVNMALDNLSDIITVNNIEQKQTLENLSDELNIKFKNLIDNIRQYNKVVVGFSGGIDSSFLIWCASKILKENTIAATISSEQMIKSELLLGEKFCKDNNINHTIIKTSIFDNQKLLQNDELRCFYCKYANFKSIIGFAESINADVVFDGSNFDDIKEDRPGMKAIKDLKVKSPLLESKLTKSDIIKLSKHYNLNLENKESNTCLITRTPLNSILTKDRLEKIDKAEDILRSYEVKNIRVRDYNKKCIIEVAEEDIDTIMKNRQNIIDKFNKLSYNEVLLNLNGYKKGKMMEKE